jgi:hypothetical protein
MSMIVQQNTGFVIGTEDDSVTRCASCGIGYSDELAEKIGTLFNLGRTFNCRRCGHEYTDLTEFDIWVRHDAAHFFNENTVRNSSWFHATDNPVWFNDIINGGDPRKEGYGEGDVMVHLGTADAAYARAVQRNEEFADYDIKARWYLYELKLKPDTLIHPVVEYDENEWPDNSSQDDEYFRELQWEPKGVTRYLNAFEQPGSISLLANAQSFTLVSCTELE